MMEIILQNKDKGITNNPFVHNYQKIMTMNCQLFFVEKLKDFKR